MKYVERVLLADRLYWIVYWPGIILIVAAIIALRTALTLYNSFPWFVWIRTWPSGIDCSLRQRWPSISIKPGFRSQLWRSDELAKFEAQ